MKESDDIANLLKQFGGRPEDYYEVTRASDARDSQARWPLLSSIEATRGVVHPPVAHQAAPARPAAAAPPPASGTTAARVEPRLGPALPAFPAPAADPAPAPSPAAAPPAAAAPAAAPPAVAAEPATPARPKAVFIPPRQRGQLQAPPRPQVSLVGDAPIHAAPAPQPAASPTPAAGGPLQAFRSRTCAPPASPVDEAPPAPASGSTPLSRVFARLSQPQAPAAADTGRDRSASLLQRLSKL